MKIVISLGGSLLTRELTAENFKKYIDVVLKLRKKGHDLIVVCGGGKVSRNYRDIAKKLGADNDLLDFVGIMATHLNASTFLAGLGKDGHLATWGKLKDAVKDVKENFGKKIVLGGGYEPGSSSDYDAAVFAEAVGADILINATTVDGVYTSDPKKDPKAKKFDKMTYDEFERVILKNPQLPGEYRLFDLVGVKLVKKAKIKTIVVNGIDPEEIVRAVEGKHRGTEIY
jgi:uridylate kinase